VCFRCGEAHRRAECQWSGRCSMCSQDHKDVVCRRNPNGKLRWEPVTSSSSQGTINMMSSTEKQFLVPPPPQQFYVLGTPQFVPMQGFPQYLFAPTPAPTTLYHISLELRVCLIRRLRGVLLLTSLQELPLLRVFPEHMCYPLRMSESKETW
jgi:hypothetical protein